MRLWLVSAILLLGGPMTLFARQPQLPAISPQQSSQLLAQLLEHKEYFELESALQGPLELSGLDRAFFEGILANRRNRIALSIERLQPLVSALAARNKDFAVLALSTLADDYEKSYQYGSAADTYAKLDQHYSAYMSPFEQQRVHTEAQRWALLRGAPAQSAHISGPFIVATRRDRMGLLEVQVHLDGHPQWMILDTGANVSTLTSSLARALGLKLSAGAATTKGIIGASIDVHTAVIPQLRVGRAVVRNVAAVVIPDKAMYVRSVNFKIPPSLGFPVLAALGRITFFKDGRFGVQIRQRANPILPRRNLFLEKLTPLVAADVGDNERLFTFDTGSSGTFLSVQFYGRHEGMFEGQRLQRFQLAGAGGSRQYTSYYLSRLRIRLGGGCTVIPDVPVLAERRGISDDYFWGNLGQTAVRAFRSYTLDFRSMSFQVDPPSWPASAACPTP